MAKLEKQMASLSTALNRAPVPKAPAPKPQRAGGARKKRPVGAEAINQGIIKISRTEMVAAVKQGTGDTVSGILKLEPDEFPFLKGLGKSFEKVKWIKIHVFWKGAGSGMTTGSLAMGVDWDASDSFTAPTREKILAYTPNKVCLTRNDCEKDPMVIPPARLRAMGWLTPDGGANSNPATRRPGTLAYTVSSNIENTKLVGEFYISYTVHMTGTRVAE